MTVAEMLSTLATKMEDEDGTKFSESLRLTALKIGQRKVARLLHNDYLMELHYMKENLSALSGQATLGSATLDYDILRAVDGVLSVARYHDGVAYNKIKYSDFKVTENYFLAGSYRDPSYYVFKNILYLLPAETTTVTVGFLRKPPDLVSGGDDCILAEELHDLVLTFAESWLWRIDDKLDRCKMAAEDGYEEIKIMNENIVRKDEE